MSTVVREGWGDSTESITLALGEIALRDQMRPQRYIRVGEAALRPEVSTVVH